MSSVCATAQSALSGRIFFLTKIFVISWRAIANRCAFFGLLKSRCSIRNRSRLAYGFIRAEILKFFWSGPSVRRGTTGGRAGVGSESVGFLTSGLVRNSGIGLGGGGRNGLLTHLGS